MNKEQVQRRAKIIPDHYRYSPRELALKIWNNRTIGEIERDEESQITFSYYWEWIREIYKRPEQDE
jgi:hypothetical protein